MANEWIIGGSFNGQWGRRADDARSKYFDGNSLKAGYTSKFLGNGENASSQGALATYTNDYDDLWDSYEPMRDRANYGIFGAPTPAAPAAGSAGPSYSPAQRTQGQSSINFNNQLAAIKAQNQASINALTQQLTDQKADYEAKELASNKRISNLSSTVANAQSQYDPTKGMGSSNNINPALSIQEKNKSLSSGTQRYNRSKLSINNLNV